MLDSKREIKESPKCKNSHAKIQKEKIKDQDGDSVELILLRKCGRYLTDVNQAEKIRQIHNKDTSVSENSQTDRVIPKNLKICPGAVMPIKELSEEN